MNHNCTFEFSPKLIILLGEQLIHDKKIALSELVKNAYDADATEVKVHIEADQIVIEDDGFGMDSDVIENIWLKPGVSSKHNSDTKDDLTPKYKRSPIGEKGIGRLGSHKLGHKIELYSKSEGSNEVYFAIDWRKFENSNKIESYQIEVKENISPIIFGQGKTGTKIIIKDLKEEWSDSDMSKLSSDLMGLVSPFFEIENFNIFLLKDNKIFEDNFKENAQQIYKDALFKFSIDIHDGHLMKFNYHFDPWTGFEKVDSRTITLDKDFSLFQKILKKKFFSLSLNNNDNPLFKIGQVKFEGFIYDFDNILWNTQRQFDKQDKALIKKYLKSNGGIRVYRDNLRVFNYGEPGNQIVDLDLKRVNRPAGHISSNQILASVVLDRKDSSLLIEKSNREGFIHNGAFSHLQRELIDVIDLLTLLWKDDKEKLRKLYVQKEYDKASIEKDIQSMINIINNSEINEYDKQKINDNFIKFKKEFNHVKDIFLNASQNGISLSLVVHELGKIIKIIDKEIIRKNWDFVTSNFNRLSHIVKIYADTIKLDKNQKKISIEELIDLEKMITEVRLDSHNIELIVSIEKDLEIHAKQNLVLGTLNNLIDNAIYWLEYQDIERKKIIIQAYKKNNEIHVLVADNGKGFTISFESALGAFISGRTDDSSMGMGLYMAKQVMEAHSGYIQLGDFDDEELPSDFAEGAIIKLVFKEI